MYCEMLVNIFFNKWELEKKYELYYYILVCNVGIELCRLNC